MQVIVCYRKLEKMSKSLEEYRTIFERLYPDRDVSSLLPLPREDLLDLLDIPGREPSPPDWLPGQPSDPVVFSPGMKVLSPYSTGCNGIIGLEYSGGGIDWIANGQHYSYNVQY
jgi:hypothetical protein